MPYRTATYRLFALALSMIMGLLTDLSAQSFERDEFGMNRIQYRQFKWRFITTENFEIYYYDDGYRLAKLAANYAEEDFSHIVNLVGYSPYGKTKVFIYKNITDLQQSNIGVKDQGIAVGGQTQFIRSEIEVAYPGNKYLFRKELTHAIADIFIFEMMYGGNLKELLRNSYLLNLPEWFMSGAARYVAYGWDKEMDDYVRDAIYNGRVKQLSKLEGKEAEIIGQSIWHYIAAEYGTDYFSNILNFTRIIRDERQSIYNTTRIRFKSFMEGWKKYYTQHTDKIIDDHKNTDEDREILVNHRDFILNMTKLSPDGRYIAWTENFKGRYKVKVQDLISGKKKTVLRGGYKVVNQKMNSEIPIIAWKANHEIAIVSTKNGRNYFWMYDLNNKLKSRKRRQFRNFNNINSFDISDDGNRMILSAEIKGRSDLYLYNIKRRTFQFLTSDEYDDIDPHFLPGGYKIAFSSNRTNDTLAVEAGENTTVSESQFNIFIYDLAEPTVLNRLTNTVSFDRMPIALTDSTIIFLSDQRGIDHLYFAEIKSGFHKQITNYRQNIQDYDFQAGRLAYIMLRNGRSRVYLSDALNINQTYFTPKTRWKELQDLFFLRKLKEDKRKEAQRIRMDSLRKADSLVRQQADTLSKSGTPPPRITEWKNTDEIDTDNWPLEPENQSQATSSSTTFLERFSAINRDGELTADGNVIQQKSQFYEQEFALDNFVTATVWDPVRQMGITFDIAMTDILENHKINLGVVLYGISGLLDNSSYYAEYEFLKRRVDYRFRHVRERMILNNENGSRLHKYTLNTFEGEMAYPLGITSRISISPFFATTRFTNVLSATSSISEPDQTRSYAGFKAEFVYDNSIVTGMNMRQGTRARIAFESFSGVNDHRESFHNIMFDARHYQKLHKSLVLATRVSGGHFFGPSSKQYLLGGMHNWFFPYPQNMDEDSPMYHGGLSNEDLTDYLLNRFATPMRGFNFGKQFGSTYVLFNAELRFPLAKYFYRGTVTSNFLRNLQLIGFYDMGAAWTGGTPFDTENDINTRVVEEGAFTARVTTFQNPFLMSYGAGARTTFLGFYVKADLSWPIENNIVRESPRLQITLGHDF